MPSFKYHPDPEKSKVVDESSGICPGCGEDRAICYVGPFYSEQDVEGICLECIADGSAAKRWNGEFVVPYSAESITDAAKVDELLHRTPGPLPEFIHIWPSHCDDFCALLGRVTWPEIERLGSKLEADLAEIEAQTQLSRDALAAELADEASALWAHLFKCLRCDYAKVVAEYE